MARARKRLRIPKVWKNPHAVALGRKGGLASASTWIERTTRAQRRAWGRKGAAARWTREKAERES